MELFLAFAVILVALIFTYTNGFHDTANAIATVVGTKVLTPRQAIMLAAVTNLFGAFFGLAVAKTISSGLVEQEFVTQAVLICALGAAIFWNLLTWWYGLPSSSSHALIGSLIGAALGAAVCLNSVAPLKDKDGNPASVWSAVKFIEIKEKKVRSLTPATDELRSALGDKLAVNGTHSVKIGEQKMDAVVFSGRAAAVVEKPKTERAGVYYKVVLPMIFSPLIGFFAGMIVMAALYLLLRNWRPVTVNRTFGRLQLVSSAYMGFSHGMNDATKCMGIITLALVAASSKGLITSTEMPTFSRSSAAAITILHIDAYVTIVTSVPSFNTSVIPNGKVNSPILSGNRSFNRYPFRHSIIKAGSSDLSIVL